MNAQPADFLYGRADAPAVLLFGDDAARRLDRLDRQAGMNVVVDLREDGGAGLDGLLMWLDAQAERAGRLSMLILTPPDLIDVVTARIADVGVRILVEPEWSEFDAALVDLFKSMQAFTSESSRDDDRRLEEEVAHRA